MGRGDALKCLPAALFPLGQVRPLGAQRGVVAVAGVDHRRIVVDVEHP